MVSFDPHEFLQQLLCRLGIIIGAVMMSTSSNLRDRLPARSRPTETGLPLTFRPGSTLQWPTHGKCARQPGCNHSIAGLHS